ncbi:MAG: gliding motility-associated C-terminal domain-containing protein [Vicingaceae bacterium]|nr:gliding motility-associated C-terminal domain-containing protein [Vicingaceae bacterium]
MINFGNDTNLCYGKSLLLEAATSNSTYLWQDNSTDYKYEVTQPGTYWVQVTNSCGVFTDTINVTYNSIPVSLGNDTSLCFGSSHILDPGIVNATYLWNTTNTTQQQQITPSWGYISTYWVEVTDSNGCGSDTINISVVPYFEDNFLGNDTILCETQQIELNTNATLVDNYLWSTGSTDSAITVSVPGQYWLEISNKCYTDYDTVNVSMTPKPIYQLENEITLCEGDTISLSVNSSQNIAYWWDSYNFPTFNPILNVYNEGTYYVTIHKQGCYYKDSVIVTTKKCDIDLTIPNVFTPNQDGINDFLIIATQNVKDYAIAIYNRWGQLVFESNDKTYHWNGTFKDAKCSSGTYFYIIEVSNEYESKTYKGTLSLMR